MRLNLLMCKGRHDKGETLTVIWVIIILTKTILTFGKVPAPTFYFILFFLHMFTYFTCLKRSSLPCRIWSPYKFITFWHSDFFFLLSLNWAGPCQSPRAPLLKRRGSCTQLGRWTHAERMVFGNAAQQAVHGCRLPEWRLIPAFFFTRHRVLKRILSKTAVNH